MFSRAQKVLSVVICMAVLFIMTLLFSTAAFANSPRTIRVALSVTRDHLTYIRIQEFTQRVNEDTNNAFRFQLFPSDQLGDWMLVTEELIRGNVEMHIGSISPAVDSRLDLTFTPYLANGLDDVANIFGPGRFIYERAKELLAGIGIVMLGFDVNGMGGLAFGNRIPDDPFAIGSGGGMVIRTPPNEHVRVFMSEMGYNPTTIPWAEVFTSVQTGVIDAFLGATASTAWRQFRDVITGFAPIDIWTSVQYIAFSEMIWNELTEEQQDVFRKHAAGVFMRSIEETRETDAYYFQQLIDHGVQVIFPQPGDLERLVQMAREKAWPASETRIGTELYRELMTYFGLPY